MTPDPDTLDQTVTCCDCGIPAVRRGHILPKGWEWYNGRPGTDRVICPACVGRVLDAALAAMRTW